MKSVRELPNDYGEYASVNLQQDKKLALFINVIALLIGALMVVPACLIVPISTLLETDDDFVGFLIHMAVLLVSMVAYMILHELVHGIAMKICGTKKVKYGFTGMYAFAGSDDYYDKKAYIFIALAPVVFWGAVLAVVNIFVPTEWFWVVYLLQVTNISGAAGDFYVTVKFFRFPKSILVRDSGTSMTVYAKQ